MELVGKARWQVGAEIGRGASGRTHEVTSDGRDAVAKVMALRETQDWKSVDLFEREVAVLESLEHPGIPRFIDHMVLDDGTTLALVMERAPGSTLHEHLRRAPATPEQLRAWLERGLEVLDYLHRRSPPIVHRDVTTKNLMVDGERLSLIDFGSVKATLRDSTVMTEVGTFGFMAPEQVMGRPIAPSDLYGLGVSLLCAAARCQPHELPARGDDGSIDVAQIPNLGSLAAVLARLTRPGLDARYPNAASALHDLRPKPAPAPTPTRAPAPAPAPAPTPAPTPAPAPAPHALAQRALAAAGAIAGLAIAANGDTGAGVFVASGAALVFLDTLRSR